MLNLFVALTNSLAGDFSLTNDLNSRDGKQKLVSNQFMRTWNAHARRAGKSPISKKQYMAITSILSRRQQKMLREQFTYSKDKVL